MWCTRRCLMPPCCCCPHRRPHGQRTAVLEQQPLTVGSATREHIGHRKHPIPRASLCVARRHQIAAHFSIKRGSIPCCRLKRALMGHPRYARRWELVGFTDQTVCREWASLSSATRAQQLAAMALDVFDDVIRMEHLSIHTQLTERERERGGGQS